MLVQDVAGSVLSHKSEIDAHLVQSLYETAIGNLRFENVLQLQVFGFLSSLEEARLFSELDLKPEDSACFWHVLFVILQNLFVLVVGPNPPAVVAPPLDPSVAFSGAPMLQKAHAAE